MNYTDALTTCCGLAQLRRFIDAISYYESCGYRYVDSPWLVQQKVSNATKPVWARPIHHHIAALNHTFQIVASGEQSFLQMQYERMKNNEELMHGKYQTLTPCYRDETKLDDFHRVGFMKLELIDWDDAGPGDMIENAETFFQQYVAALNRWNNAEFCVDIVTPEEVELGSYGSRATKIREFELSWSYGTGLAEPRLTQAIKSRGL